MPSPPHSGIPRLGADLPPLRGVLPLILGLVLWQAFGPARSAYFPPPSSWFLSLAELIRHGKLFPALGSTLLTFAVATLLAALIGGVSGILIGTSRHLRRALGPLLEFGRALPPPVIVPVAVLLLGYAESLKLLVVVWVAIWPFLLNSAAATSGIDSLLLDTSRTFRLGALARLRKVVAPAVLPAFLLGLRVAVPLAIIVTLLVEMVTMLPGIGSLIVTAQREYRSAEVYGLLVLVGLIGFVLNNFVILLETVLLSRWPPRAHAAQ